MYIGEYIGNVSSYTNTREERCGNCEGCWTFDYDPPLILELRAGVNMKPETYLFRGGEQMTVIGQNFGIDAQVAVGPDPNTGVTYFCNFTRPFEINSLGCQIEGVGYECLFCLLGPGGGAYPITVWLAAQHSVINAPFKFRGTHLSLCNTHSCIYIYMEV